MRLNVLPLLSPAMSHWEKWNWPLPHFPSLLVVYRCQWFSLWRKHWLWLRDQPKRPLFQQLSRPPNSTFISRVIMGEVVQMHFSTVDYVIFVLLLVASAGIGLFYAFSGGRQRTTQVAKTKICSLFMLWLYLCFHSVRSAGSWTDILFLPGVSDGWPLHELLACVPVPFGHFPVSCGHPGCSVWGVHLWHPVLVLGLLLLLGPAHTSSCFHTSLLQTAAVQCLWGIHKTHIYFNVFSKKHSLIVTNRFLCFPISVLHTVDTSLSFLLSSMISEFQILICPLICLSLMR